MEAIADTIGKDTGAARARADLLAVGLTGAAEIAATVDYLAAFAGLVPVVTPQHFEAIYDAYVADDAVRHFLITRNPAAARAVGRRLASMIAAGSASA